MSLRLCRLLLAFGFPRKLAITQVEAQDANGAPRSYLRLEWVASYSDPSVCAEEAMNPVVFEW